ncbi:Tim44/TimA family putative adaptor protein [Sphingorhabdus arenilitoris]|uniref:Tim44/TimA family putative adaptor protein n=1 Tax=Sphingorhabdus arenilitoris TaxID=1490041 RepID=A0ABV8RK58_9SPHN
MVAGFLGLRLYSVLGKRTGHEQEPVARQPLDEQRSAPVIAPAPMMQPAGANNPPAGFDMDQGAESGLRAIMNADRQFDPALFVEGAKSAYKVTLEAFWKGDRSTLQFLCDDDVLDDFVEVIAEREERGEVLENRLIRIETARIVRAEYDHPLARITMRFDADIAALVKDGEGNIIGGTMSDAVEAHDIWTFVRDVKSGDRNWKLDETDAV